MTPESCLETLNERGEAAGIGYGTILWPELRTHVQMAKKDYNSGWFSLLTELYDSAPSLIRATRSYKWHIKRPTVTLVAGVQPDFMKEHITDDMIAGGFLPRFILLAPTYGQYRECYSPVPVTRDQREKTLMREGLAALRDKHTVDEKGDGFRLGIDDMAKEFLGGWAMAIRDDPAQDDEQYLGSFYSRFQDQLIKLAGLITLSRGVEVVDMKSMNIAVQLVEHQKAVAHWFLRNRGNSKFDGWLDRCRRKTLRWMDDNPGEPVVPRSAIYRSLSGQGFSAANMRTIEITLTEQGFFKEVGVKWGKPMKEEPRWKKDR